MTKKVVIYSDSDVIKELFKVALDGFQLEVRLSDLEELDKQENSADISLAVIDGWERYRSLVESLTQQSVPLVVLVDEHPASEEGWDKVTVLTKPLTFVRVLSCIREYVDLEPST